MWAWLEGGISLGRILLSLLVLLLVLAVVCAIGLMFSTLTARPVSSAVLTYLAMGVLVFGTVIGFGLTAFLVTQEETVSVYGIPDDWWEKNSSSVAPPPATEPMEPVAPLEPTRADCTTFDRRTTVAHTERIWWMLPLNPFVVVADAAPSGSHPGGDVRRVHSDAVDQRRRPGGSQGATDEIRQECNIGTNFQESPDPLADTAQRAPVWPYGLGFLLVSGVGATLIAIRRLRAHPQAAQRHPHRLSRPRGIRLALLLVRGFLALPHS